MELLVQQMVNIIIKSQQKGYNWTVKRRQETAGRWPHSIVGRKPIEEIPILIE